MTHEMATFVVLGIIAVGMGALYLWAWIQGNGSRNKRHRRHHG